jgi:hypothetical protein
MKFETTIAPPNSIVLVVDFETGQVPRSFNGQLIAATETCVAVGTLSEQDGETTIVLTDEASPDVIASNSLAFDDSIAIRGGALSVVTAWNEPVLSLPVHTENVRVRVWVNHRSEPDHIVIVAE